MEPRPEQGILINFGTSDVGSGEVQPDNPGENTEAEVQETEVTETNEATPSDAEQEVLNQDNVETVAVPEEKEKTQEEIDAERKAEEERKKQEEFKNKLNQMWNKSKSGDGSEGDDNEQGDKGQLDGDKSPGAYSGTPGGGGGGNGDYQLSGRNALKKVKPNYDCQESGRVVVQVKVDRDGNTISASVEMKLTTNMASCLTSRAKQAAMKTKWEAKKDAPDFQVGRIVYNFELN